MFPGPLQPYILFLILLCLRGAQGQQSSDNYEEEALAEQKDGQHEAVDYFRNYGYLPDGLSSSSMAQDKFDDAVLEFQRKMGLEMTGKLDAQTSEMLSKSRCGNKDDVEEFENLEQPPVPTDLREKAPAAKKRSKRFALHGAKWKDKRLLYKISGYTPKLEKQKAQVGAVFDQAFKTWTKAAQLEFEETDDLSKAHLEIKFVPKYHGNCEIGQLNDKVLAHAHPPTLNRKLRRGIHFNDRIDWQVEAGETTFSLLPTAVHEIGHALGLAHSKYSDTKMFPIENGLTKLHQDDVRGIQTLYGSAPKLKQFYTLDKKWFVDPKLDLYEKTVETLEECADYALQTKYNLTVFNKDKKKCLIKNTHNHENLIFYRSDGTGVLAQGPDLYAPLVTNTTEELDSWIKGQECDNIVKEVGEFIDQYHCKRYETNDCCTILMRIDANRAAEPILEAAKEESLASIIG